jgi:DNA-directed RNA polymerase specialized sigma24 family protein
MYLAGAPSWLEDAFLWLAGASSRLEDAFPCPAGAPSWLEDAFPYLADASSRLEDAFTYLAGAPSWLEDAFPYPAGGPSWLEDAFLSLAGAPSWQKDAFPYLAGAPSWLEDAFPYLAGASSRLEDVLPFHACTPAALASPSATLVPAPPSDPTAPDASSGPSLPANDVAPSSARAVAAFVDEPPPPSGVALNPVKTALFEFLASKERGKGRDYIKGVVIRKLGPKIERELLDDLVQYACTEALQADSPPWTVGGIPGWVGRVTRRQIAHYFQARKDDEENLDPDAHAHDPFDRHAPQTDWGAREHLICKWLEKEIGPDPRRRETFRLILEHEIAGKPLGELAVEHRTTEAALSNRFHKLRKELAPKVARMDEEKPRRFVLLALFGFGFAALVAVLYWLMLVLFPHAPPPPRMLPEPAPTVSAAPAPTFDQALPTTPAPNDAGDLKPQQLKP